jgi:hypothetical protein
MSYRSTSDAPYLCLYGQKKQQNESTIGPQATSQEHQGIGQTLTKQYLALKLI